MTPNTDLETDSLPATVRDFLAAHVVRDADTASSFLTEDTVVVDQDGSFPRGVADLDHRFALRDGLVAELVVADHEA